MVQKLGRLKQKVKDMGNLMDVLTRYAESGNKMIQPPMTRSPTRARKMVARAINVVATTIIMAITMAISARILMEFQILVLTQTPTSRVCAGTTILVGPTLEIVLITMRKPLRPVPKTLRRWQADKSFLRKLLHNAGISESSLSEPSQWRG